MLNATTRLVVILVGCLFASLAAGSETETPQTTTPDFMAQYRAIRQDADKKLSAIDEQARSKIDLSVDLANQRELIEDIQAQSTTVLSSATERIFPLVAPHAADPAAVEPLAWIATQRSNSDIGRAAFDLLVKHHLVRGETIEIATSLSRSLDPRAKSLLRTQLASTDLKRDVRWKVLLSLARLLQREAAMASRLSSATEDELARFVQMNGAERVAEWKQADASALEEEAIALFGSLEREYPEQIVIPSLTVAEFARSSVFEIKHLRVGQAAPDIMGADLKGEEFKLSDYRGKVVLLSFWASWCGPCMAEVPHERKLVEQYQGKPFELVGVNADIARGELDRAVDKFDISWRSFSCGPAGPLGPIAKAWNVSSWPTVYVIDHEGVIRGKNLSGAALDAKLAELVPAAEQAIRK